MLRFYSLDPGLVRSTDRQDNMPAESLAQAPALRRSVFSHPREMLSSFRRACLCGSWAMGRLGELNSVAESVEVLSRARANRCTIRRAAIRALDVYSSHGPCEDQSSTRTCCFAAHLTRARTRSSDRRPSRGAGRCRKQQSARREIGILVRLPLPRFPR